MSVVAATLQVLQALAPIIEHLVKAALGGNGLAAIEALKIPHPLKSEVALAAKLAGLK